MQTDQSADLAKVDLLYYYHALKRRGLFDIVENDMTEMKDDPARPQTELNNVPLYRARWPKGKVVDGVYVPGEVGSGWRRDQADTVALAIRMNGHVIRGYFAGMI